MRKTFARSSSLDSVILGCLKTLPWNRKCQPWSVQLAYPGMFRTWVGSALT